MNSRIDISDRCILMLRNAWFIGSNDVRLFDGKHSWLVRMPNGDIMASKPGIARSRIENVFRLVVAVENGTAEFNVIEARQWNVET